MKIWLPRCCFFLCDLIWRNCARVRLIITLKGDGGVPEKVTISHLNPVFSWGPPKTETELIILVKDAV